MVRLWAGYAHSCISHIQLGPWNCSRVQHNVVHCLQFSLLYLEFLCILYRCNRHTVSIHIFICTIGSTHVAVVILNSVRNWNSNMLILSFPPSFYRVFRIRRKPSQTHSNYRVFNYGSRKCCLLCKLFLS